MKTEEELLIYKELGDWLDKYDRWMLHSKEHQALASRIALALTLLERSEG
jgi:hypothetical protein